MKVMRWLSESLGHQSKSTLTSHNLITGAKLVALLEDFGRSEFRRRLDTLISEAPAEVHADLADYARNALVRRAELVDWEKKHPEWEKPVSPTFVVGLPSATIADDSGGLDESFVGLSQLVRFGAELWPATESEASEIYHWHAVTAARDHQDRFAGVDHLLMWRPAKAAYPDARFEVVSGSPEVSIRECVAAEQRRAAEVGRAFDSGEAFAKWKAVVERCETALSELRSELSV